MEIRLILRCVASLPFRGRISAKASFTIRMASWRRPVLNAMRALTLSSHPRSSAAAGPLRPSMAANPASRCARAASTRRRRLPVISPRYMRSWAVISGESAISSARP